MAMKAGEGVFLDTNVLVYSAPLGREQLLNDVRYFQRHFSVAEDNLAVTEALLDLMLRFDVSGRQIHDANIVATMLAYAIPALLTHNTSDFARYTEVIAVSALDARSI